MIHKVFFSGMVLAIVILKNKKAKNNRMKWIEVIKLRSPGIKEDIPDKNILVKLAQVNRTGGPREIQIYRHATLESDMSVHLTWITGSPESGESAVGMQIIEFLKPFGLVNHSIWAQEETVGGLRS